MVSRSEITAWRANCSGSERLSTARPFRRRRLRRPAIPSPTSHAVANTATLATTVAGPNR